MPIALRNSVIFTSKKFLSHKSLILDEGKIVAIIDDDALDVKIDSIDLQGHLLVPGFIDTQVNGGAGVLFNHQPNVAGIRAIGHAHRQFGTTGFLATLISDDEQTMRAAITAGQQAITEKVPGFLGLHLEGPYLNTARKGVHCESKLCSPNPNSLQLLAPLAKIGSSMVTLAPENVTDAFIQQLCAAGIIVSIGHSNADFNKTRQAIDNGVRGFTHLYNAMSPLTSREPGVVGAALDDADTWCGIIVDGHHVHPSSLRVAIKAKATGKMMLVTDAVHSVGSTESQFELAGQKIYKKSGKVATAQGTLAGSDLDMASAVRNCVNLLNIELEESLRMASLYPAQFLKQAQHLGKIETGYKANFTLLNKQLEVVDTWIDGVSSKVW